MQERQEAGQGPLAGLRVVEMAGIGPAPFAAMMLADLGASVIRVTRPGQVDPLGLAARFNLIERGRPRVEIDLRDAAGKASLRALIARADALIEGFRPGVMERLGFGPEPMLALNQRLIYGRMTGWGQEGPMAQTAGHDLNYLALTGAVASLGPSDGPPSPPMNLVADFGGGGMYLAYGITAALLARSRTGRGQVVDAAMVDGAALLMAMASGLHAAGEMEGGRGGNLLDGGAPFYRCYATSDEQWLTFCPIEPQFWAEALGLLGLAGEPLFSVQNDRARWKRQAARLSGIFAAQPLAHWEQLFAGSDACFAPAVPLADVPHHPHNAARESYSTVAGVPQPVPGPRFSATPAGPPGAVPESSIAVEDALALWLEQDAAE